jgi:hypothetical protein
MRVGSCMGVGLAVVQRQCGVVRAEGVCRAVE